MQGRTTLENQIYQFILKQDMIGLLSLSLTDDDTFQALKIAFASVLCTQPERKKEYAIFVINLFKASKLDVHKEMGWGFIAEIPKILAQLNCIREAIDCWNEWKTALENYIKISYLRKPANDSDHIRVSLIPIILQNHHSFANFLIYNRNEEHLKKIIKECQGKSIFKECLMGLMSDANTTIEDIKYLEQFYLLFFKEQQMKDLQRIQFQKSVFASSLMQGRFHFFEDLCKNATDELDDLIKLDQDFYSSFIYKHLNTPAKAGAVATSLKSDEFWLALCKYAQIGKSTPLHPPISLSGFETVILEKDHPFRQTILRSEEFDINICPSPSYFKFQREYQYNKDVCDAWLNKDIRHWILFCGGLIWSSPGGRGLSVDVFLNIARFLYPKDLSVKDLQTLQTHKYRIFLFHDLNKHLEQHHEDQQKVEKIKTGLLSCNSKASISDLLSKERKTWFAKSGSERSTKKRKLDSEKLPDIFENNIKRMRQLF